MAAEVFPLVLGSNEPIVVQLFDAANDDGVSGIDLTGATAMSAKAKDVAGNHDTGSGLAAAISGAPTLGKVQITYLATAFPAVGTYDLQITYTDGIGNKRIYPSEGNQLKIKVVGAN